MKKILFLLITFLFIPVLNAKVENIDYDIKDYLIDSQIDGSGNLVVKEILKIEGNYNGFIRDILFRNLKLQEFTGKDSDFEHSDIYNASNIEFRKIGIIKVEKEELDYYLLENPEITEFSECSDSINCYELTDINDEEKKIGTSVKLYNETHNGVTYFYLEYLLGNVVVLHNDVAEIYYNFVGDSFTDTIQRFQGRVTFPSTTSKEIKVWAHGPLNGVVSKLGSEEEKIFYGGYFTIKDLNPNTSVDLRMTFPLDLIFVEHPFQKRTEIDALDKILNIEEQRANEANTQRSFYKVLVYGTYTLSIIYILGLIGLVIIVYIKYDKEPKSSFKGEYYREFIDDYDVTNIEYLFNKKITDRAFSTSIVNMIYKKNIKCEKINNNDYWLILINKEGLDEAELKIIDLLFYSCGNGEKVNLMEIKKYAKNIKGTSSPFLNKYNSWKNEVTTISSKNNFYENNTKVKITYSLYGLLSILMVLLNIWIGKNNLSTILILIIIPITIIFIIYILSFTKRTQKGVEHYTKWKSFKKFLSDFGRFNEKELPEISLWERYLVYATIFGLADKVSKEMKIKFEEYNYSNNVSNFDLYDYMLFYRISDSIHSTVNSSISEAKNLVAKEMANSVSSSGSGGGGGFSSGGGFGGGGGGGHGF